MRARTTVLAVALAALAAIGLPGAASGADPMTVTPVDALVDAQAVTVSFSGDPGGELFGLCQTTAGAAPTREWCGGPLNAVSDPSQPYTYQVRRFIHVPALGRTVDCADPAERCVIHGMIGVFELRTVAEVPLRFSAPPPPPAARGTITVAPASDLADRQRVVVTGTGFRPSVGVEVMQCRAAVVDPTSCGAPTVLQTDAAGSFTHERTVDETLDLATDWTDCGVGPRCVLAAAEVADVAQTLVTARIHFASESVPVLTVAPDEGLVEGTTVAVEGTGFPPFAHASACQTLVGVEPFCAPVSGTVASDGTVAFELELRRHLYVASDQRTVDCADPSTACAVHVHADGEETWAPLSFAPSPPPPATRGTVVVQPAQTVEGDALTVAGTAFRPGAAVRIVQCGAAVLDPSGCTDTAAVATADAAGAFTARLAAKREVFVPLDTVGCAPAGACVVAAFEVVDPVGTFSTAPVRVFATPTVAVTPDAELRDGRPVTVRSGTWPTGSVVHVRQCASGSEPLACAPGNTLTVGDDGSVATELTVQRRIGAWDCVTQRCIVSVSRDPRQLGASSPIEVVGGVGVDAQLVRLINASLIGDDVVNDDGAGQSQRRTVTQGQSWSFAIRVENEGEQVDDLVLRAGAPAPGVEIDYFYARWFDVTAQMTAPEGLRLTGFRPGEARTIVARFRVAPAAEPGSVHESLVSVRSSLDAQAVDAVVPGVVVAPK